MNQTATNCLSCGEAVLPQDKFCEGCGHPLCVSGDPAPAPPAPAPPAPTPSPEGNCSFCGDAIHDEYCTACGAQRKFPDRDRIELELPGIAGVSDRGRKHTRNEDGMQLAAIPERNAFVAVVCDGMSTAQNSDIASQRACDVACAHLVAAVQADVDLETAMKEAGDLAQAAVCSVPYNKAEAVRNSRRCVPACTFTAVVAVPGRLVIGNIGDSRSYYVGTVNVRVQLSDDDSWAADQIKGGKLSEAEAMSHEDAHALMQWLGEDNDPVCGIKSVEIAEDGHLLLVSDGFWNYALTPAAVAVLVRKQPAGATALQIARALTQFANDAGGHDNITIVVVPLKAA